MTKKHLLVAILMATTLFSQGQELTVNKLTARKTIQLNDWRVTAFRRDTLLNDNLSLPTAKAVYDFVIGRMANVSGLNFYNSNGTMTANRVVNAAGNNVIFNNVNNWNVTGNSFTDVVYDGSFNQTLYTINTAYTGFSYNDNVGAHKSAWNLNYHDSLVNYVETGDFRTRGVKRGLTARTLMLVMDTVTGRHWYTDIPAGTGGGAEVDPVYSASAAGGITAPDIAAWNAKQAALGFTPENSANKATDFTVVNDTKYPTTKATADYVAAQTSPQYVRNGLQAVHPGDTILEHGGSFVHNTSVSGSNSYGYLLDSMKYVKIKSIDSTSIDAPFYAWRGGHNTVDTTNNKLLVKNIVTGEENFAPWSLGSSGGGGGGTDVTVVATVNASGASSVIFPVSGAYASYEIRGMNISGATNDVKMCIRFSTDGGSTYDAGPHDYFYTYIYASTGDISDGGTGTDLLELNNVIPDASHGKMQMRLTIFNPSSTANISQVEWTIGGKNSFSTVTNVRGNGWRDANQDTDHIKIFLWDGSSVVNVTGTFELIGYK